MKYCINCKHYEWSIEDNSKKFGWCNHRNNFKRNVVSGGFDRIYTFAYMNRNDPKSCGLSGKWFEQKILLRTKIKNLFKRK